MVLSNQKPYDSDSLDDGEDPWEMIDEHESETTPLATGAQIIVTDTPDIDIGGAGDEVGRIDERESQQLESDDDENNDLHLSVVSGVSSITGYHHTVSDVDEESLHDGTQIENGGEDTVNFVPGIGEDDANEEEAPTTDAAPSDSPEKTDAEKSEENSESEPLVEQLSQMGFEKEQIEKAIGELRETGATEIDADSVIGSMAGENNGGPAPLGSTWDFVESTVQDLDSRHQLRRRTQNCVRNISRSAQDIWSNVNDESEQFRSNLRETFDQADVHARNASSSVRFAALSAKDSFCRANEEYRITEKLATVAVVGGATLLALGNPRAGVGAMAVAGATLAAGEAMKNSSAQSSSPYTRDHGLNEGVHID